MKTLGYIYGIILKALEGSITVEQALQMIRAVLTLEKTLCKQPSARMS